MTGILHAVASSGGPVISITSLNPSNTNAGGGTASVTIEWQSDGDEGTREDGGAFSDVSDWIIPKSAAPGSYEIRLTVDSGDAPTSGDLTATWLALSSPRSWTLEQSGVGSKLGTYTVEIRLNTTVLDSATCTMSATVDP